MNPEFDPRPALRVLLSHDVRFVVVGGIAGVLLGSPSLTFDLDICYDRGQKNLEALADALKELKATLRGAPADLPFLLDAKTLRMGDSFTFDTATGSLDCLGTPSGTTGYADLMKNAKQVETVGGLRVWVASIDDLIRMKRAAGRPKDRIAVEILTALKEEREKLTPPA
ncbi:MAG TPA: hypothetical protein VJZ00_15655 [Thermoanaerobaculia bacterium]|nr:hypothetical protein [Thermoanaerobaculia bacterium]